MGYTIHNWGIYEITFSDFNEDGILPNMDQEICYLGIPSKWLTAHS